MTVRELEKIVAAIKQNLKDPNGKEARKKKSPFVKAYENQLMDKFGTDVRISERGARGKIQIEYTSQSDLNRILVDVLNIDLDE